MAHMPHEPEAFAECVADMLRRLQPEYAIDLVGPRELLVNGRRLDLENLFRMVNHEPTRGTEIVEHYLEQLFAGEAVQLSTMSFDFAKPRIMPRIQPESIFEHLSREQVAHVPWVNDTVVVFVTDLPHMTVSITTEQLVRWKVSVDAVEEIARENLDNYAPELEIQLVESKEGGRAAILGQHDGYDAARLMLGGLYQRLASQLGGDFYVAVPARDMFVAFSRGPEPFVRRLRERVDADYRRLPYPICPDFFFVTRDGVAGTKEITMEHGEAA
ncbi:MAG TPA: DUF1444 family protein [Phycisphaerales bacterium]|nr:DUF1444 family protein [Phycisphaerales bacterium]